MTTLDERPAVDAFADFTQVDELLERAMVLEIVVHTGHLDRTTLEQQPDLLITAAVQLWLEKILPFEEHATANRYLSAAYTDAPDAYLLHHRMGVAAGRVARLYGREEFLPDLLDQVDRLPHPSAADLLAEVLLCESAGYGA